MMNALPKSSVQSGDAPHDDFRDQHIRTARYLLDQINAPSNRDPIYCFGHTLDLFATLQLLDIPSVFIRQDIHVRCNPLLQTGRSSTEFYTPLPYIQVHGETISFWGSDENEVIEHAKDFLRVEMMGHFSGKRPLHQLPGHASVEDALLWEIKSRRYSSLPHAQNSVSTANPAEITRLYAAAIEMHTARCEGQDSVRRI